MDPATGTEVEVEAPRGSVPDDERKKREGCAPWLVMLGAVVLTLLVAGATAAVGLIVLWIDPQDDSVFGVTTVAMPNGLPAAIDATPAPPGRRPVGGAASIDGPHFFQPGPDEESSAALGERWELEAVLDPPVRDPILALGFDEGGDLLAIATTRGTGVYSLDSGAFWQSLAQSSPTVDVAIDPEGEYLATVHASTLRLWFLSYGYQQTMLDLGTDVVAVGLGRDEERALLATVDVDGEVAVYFESENLPTFTGTTTVSSVRDVVFSADGRRLFVIGEGVIERLTPQSGGSLRAETILEGHAGLARGSVAALEGRLALGGPAPAFLDLETGGLTPMPFGALGVVAAFRDRVAGGGPDGTVVLVDDEDAEVEPASTVPTTGSRAEPRPIVAVGWSPNRHPPRFAAADEAGRVFVWRRR